MSESFRPVGHPSDLRSWPGDMPIESLYTAGIAYERFLIAIRDEGKLLGTRCESCGRVFGPPRMYCEKTLEDMSDNWVEIGPEGTVHSLTFVHVDMEDKRLAAPDVLASIQLDGADTVLIHRLDPSTARDVKVGTKVAPVFKPEGERAGSINDIAYFKPV